MSNKTRIYLLGLVTLIGFPIPAVLALHYINGTEFAQIFEFNHLLHWHSLLGLAWGVIFALISMFCFQFSFFDQELKKQEQLILSLNLTLFDKVFLSFCAGFGEEILFRAGMQHWLGIIFTSILFVAVHGYLNPKNWKLSIYGLLLLPFIFSLAIGYEKLGLWFCILAHFSYDLVLFISIKETPDDTKSATSYIHWEELNHSEEQTSPE